ncbi:MAG: hypothetical protein ACPG4T_23025, partial [Nannocystaceae bacterium]
MGKSWIELELERDGQAVRLSARGSRGERVAAYELAPVNMGRLTGLTSGVRRAVASGKPLAERVIEGAREVYRAVFRDELRDILGRLDEAAKSDDGHVLIRLMTHTSD